jgi:hypothetical protein
MLQVDHSPLASPHFPIFYVSNNNRINAGLAKSDLWSDDHIEEPA